MNIQTSRYYNPQTFRLDYPAGFLQHMPIKTIDVTELVKLMCHDDYNPSYYYENKVKLQKNEVGHDEAYRYIYKPNKPL